MASGNCTFAESGGEITSLTCGPGSAIEATAGATFIPAVVPQAPPAWMTIRPFTPVAGKDWDTMVNFLDLTKGDSDQYAMATEWRSQVDSDSCANMWPATGNSDTLSAVFDTAGVQYKSGTYYHELDVVAGPYPRFRDDTFNAAGVDTPYTKTCGDAPTCTGTPAPLADACTGTPTDTSLTCDVDASTDECPAGCGGIR